jgi:hypothetical protein
MDKKIKTFGALLPRYSRAGSLSPEPSIPASALKAVMPEPAITPW